MTADERYADFLRQARELADVLYLRMRKHGAIEYGLPACYFRRPVEVLKGQTQVAREVVKLFSFPGNYLIYGTQGSYLGATYKISKRILIPSGLTNHKGYKKVASRSEFPPLLFLLPLQQPYTIHLNQRPAFTLPSNDGANCFAKNFEAHLIKNAPAVLMNIEWNPMLKELDELRTSIAILANIAEAPACTKERASRGAALYRAESLLAFLSGNGFIREQILPRGKSHQYRFTLTARGQSELESFSDYIQQKREYPRQISGLV